ncbi:putative DNA-binding transcriptional regulator YafY [Lachnospiraceae bacterium PF1-21]
MKIDRLISIIMTLLEKERVGAGELAEMFEVSPRTIYRDIDTINLAGIPIYSVPGVGGGFEIMQNYKVDKKIFSSADLSAILMGLSNFSTMIRGEELVNALAKVKSFIPADKANDIELKANQVYIDLSPWMGNKKLQTQLEIAKAAIQECRLLSFKYADRHGNRTERTAEPYQLVLKGSHWYLQGYCKMRSDFRLFKISRISDLQVGEDFTPREYSPPNLDFSDVLETMQIAVTLRIHKSILERMFAFYDFETIIPDGKDHYLINTSIVENDYYYSNLLSYGSKCECLEPLHVRNEIKLRIQDLSLLYQG